MDKSVPKLTKNPHKQSVNSMSSDFEITIEHREFIENRLIKTWLALKGISLQKNDTNLSLKIS